MAVRRSLGYNDAMDTPPPANPPTCAAPGELRAVPGPASRALLRTLGARESRHVTAIGERFPVVWQRARGATIEDADGHTYLDVSSAFGVSLLGHGHDAVRAAVHAQTDALLHGMGDVHPPAVRIELLDALLGALPPPLTRGVLCGGGSEAVEVALKTAALTTGRPGVIAFHGGYHGLSGNALDVTSRRDFRAPFVEQLARNTTFVPYPHSRRVPAGVAPEALLDHVLGRVEEALAHPAAGGLPVGAVLVEPLQGRGGTVVPPPGFLAGLQRLCRRHGALLVCDEIFTGCGRVDGWLASAGQSLPADERVVPDLVCLGKALGGGLPIGVCVGSEAAMAGWPASTGEALHTSTFLGHPLACAAALAVLQATEREQVFAQVATAGAWWQQALGARLAGHDAVAEVRGRGLMWGVELVDPSAPMAVVERCLARGLIVLPCGVRGEVLQLTPPAVMTDEERALAVQILATALDEVCR